MSFERLIVGCIEHHKALGKQIIELQTAFNQQLIGQQTALGQQISAAYSHHCLTLERILENFIEYHNNHQERIKHGESQEFGGPEMDERSDAGGSPLNPQDVDPRDDEDSSVVDQPVSAEDSEYEVPESPLVNQDSSLDDDPVRISSTNRRVAGISNPRSQKADIGARLAKLAENDSEHSLPDDLDHSRRRAMRNQRTPHSQARRKTRPPKVDPMLRNSLPSPKHIYVGIFRALLQATHPNGCRMSPETLGPVLEKALRSGNDFPKIDEGYNELLEGFEDGKCDVEKLKQAYVTIPIQKYIDWGLKIFMGIGRDRNKFFNLTKGLIRSQKQGIESYFETFASLGENGVMKSLDRKRTRSQRGKGGDK
jgi:hypothetical protein